jgi:hypothetical protein
MAREIINVGTLANDGTGDTLRTLGNKVNNNFTELYTLLGGGEDNVTALTDSGLTFYGPTYNHKIGFVEGAGEISIDFPDSAGEVVVDTATQTLTNKTLDSAELRNPLLESFRVKDNDSSHEYTFIGGGLTTDVDVNIPSLSASDTLVMNARTATLTNKTLTAPQVNRGKFGEYLADSLNLPVISFKTNDLTRQQIKIASTAVSGSGPVISTTGSDTNVNLNITAGGTGSVKINKPAFTTAEVANGGTVSSSAGTVVLTGSSTGIVTLSDGTTDGESLQVIRKNSGGNITLSIGSFAQGSTGLVFGDAATANLVWETTSGWHVVGGYAYAIDSALGAPWFRTF